MRGKTASPSQAFRGRAGKLSFSGRKTGISGQGNAGGTADTSGGRVRLQDKDSEKCYAKAAENKSEPIPERTTTTFFPASIPS